MTDPTRDELADVDGLIDEPIRLTMGQAAAKLARLRDALEAIRNSATIHAVGGAFEPEHMQAIALHAEKALTGRDDIAIAETPAAALVAENENLQRENVRINAIIDQQAERFEVLEAEIARLKMELESAVEREQHRVN